MVLWRSACAVARDACTNATRGSMSPAVPDGVNFAPNEAVLPGPTSCSREEMCCRGAGRLTAPRAENTTKLSQWRRR